MQIEMSMSCRGRCVVITSDGGIWLHVGDGLVQLVPSEPAPRRNAKGERRLAIVAERA